MPVVIFAAVLALFGHMRALADGYTDEAAFARAITVFAIVFVVLQALVLGWRTWRTRRRALSGAPREPAPEVARPVAAHPPRREHTRSERDAGGDRHRAA